jgi:hypothetical protein
MSAIASSMHLASHTLNAALVVPVGRDARLDFFRGIALVMIFINHVSGNVFSHVTLQKLGFADAAEVFVFIAGMAGTFAYRKAFLKNGLGGAFRAVGARIRTLYLVHLGATAAVIALALATLSLGSGFEIVAKLGLKPLFEDPFAALIRVPLLSYQPHYLDILPLYVLLLAALPLVFAGFKLHLALPLVLAVALYGYVQITGSNLPDLGDEAGWFLNPMAWLLLFVSGATAAEATARDVWVKMSRSLSLMLTLAASAYVIFAFVYAAPWTAVPGLELFWVDYFNIESSKTSLSWHRLLDILAKIWLVSVCVPRACAFMQSGLGGAISRAGRHSLPVFVTGIFLSLLASIAIYETGGGLVWQLAINSISITLMFGLAWWLEGGRVAMYSPMSKQLPVQS